LSERAKAPAGATVGRPQAWLSALAVLLACATTVLAAPTVTVRARTRIRIDNVARTGEQEIRVIGRLVDALTNDGVPSRLVTVRLGESDAAVTTEPNGLFTADFELPAGTYEVAVSFAGDTLYAETRHEGQRFDVGKDTLHLALRTRGDLAPDDEVLEATLEASTSIGPQSVEVELFIEDAAISSGAPGTSGCTPGSRATTRSTPRRSRRAFACRPRRNSRTSPPPRVRCATRGRSRSPGGSSSSVATRSMAPPWRSSTATTSGSPQPPRIAPDGSR
jgi:hypothetical protein